MALLRLIDHKFGKVPLDPFVFLGAGAKAKLGLLFGGVDFRT
jgi:hypothetical protein